MGSEFSIDNPNKVLTKLRAFAIKYLRVNKSILVAISARASKYLLNVVAMYSCVHLGSLIWVGTASKVWPVKLTKRKTYSKTLNATAHVVESSLL
jgi:hypothetical protein